ncbi:TetR/AcrR family transcriptional regulator [Herbiconiux daphne]|uniref:TetR/AcrR family transcriptional regulator n=1 Tax=Herbiconiux daphne TaxID=2970914 RepID=A0ABT2H3M0_9MICO|nr:TetR/AcrR family transcriptional regulator [Herbiconiux daphne]MCS5734533.1 TetR/AcrR family transcriptional regulator [Herbiconiux daphne]
MPRRSGRTREDIREVALELIAERGFEQTSFRDIAERLDITKQAVQYHFSSKDALIDELIRPMIVDLEAFLGEATEAGAERPRLILELYLDLLHRHRQILQGLIRDHSALARHDVIHTLLHERSGLDELLVGTRPADRTRAIVALGGLQDCAVLLADVPLAEYRRSAVDSALRALTP